MRGLRLDLEKTNLKIMPTEIGGQAVFDSPSHWWKAYGTRRHLLGVLVRYCFIA